MLPRDDLRTPQPPFSATTTFSTGPPTPHHGYFLPNNPMPYLAPSVTHQPELLLLHWMLRTISLLVEDLQHHPIVQDPIPPMSTFTNTSAYRLFLQTRNTLRHLINTTHDARRGLHRLQFLPEAPQATTALIPPLTFHHSKPTSSPEPPYNVPQPHHHPSTHHRSPTESAAETDLVPETGFPLPHSHSRTTQPLDTRPCQTDLLQLPATADTCIKHFGRLPTPAPPHQQLTTCLRTHRPPPPEAPGHRLVSHITLRSEKTRPFRFLHTFSILLPSSHTFISAAI